MLIMFGDLVEVFRVVHHVIFNLMEPLFMLERSPSSAFFKHCFQLVVAWWFHVLVLVFCVLMVVYIRSVLALKSLTFVTFSSFY